MAKPLAEIIAFPTKQTLIVPFPISQLCGCGCGTLLNIEEDSFIRCEETGQWYMDEFDFLKGVEAIERNGRYQFKHTEYWYTKSEFYEELRAYWMNDYLPIA